jgi:hypothetical protein
VVQENYFYVAYDTLMHAERDLGVKHDRYVINVVYSRRVVRQVTCASLPISIVIGRNHNNLLAQLREPKRQFIHHDPKAPDRGPPAELRRAEHNRSQLISLHKQFTVFSNH